MTGGDEYRMDALVIGVDAGCPNVFDRLRDEGAVPTIADRCEEGVAASMESRIPPWTPSAWPSTYTGVDPGKHGVCGFVDFDGYDWSVVTGEDVREHRSGRCSTNGGCRAWWSTSRSRTRPRRSTARSCRASSARRTRPATRRARSRRFARRSASTASTPTTRGDESLSDAEKMVEYRALVRIRGEAFEYLVEKHRPDSGFVQFQKTDTVFHEFDGDWEKVRTVYEATDARIASGLETCDPKRVFLVSDHGMGEYDDREFRVNEFLRQEGFVELTNSGKGMPSWNPIRDDLREGKDVDS